jgi:hypothetical protein
MSEIVAISIDKVQAFLYDGIHSYKQENQTNNKTLRSIINASKEISESFYKAIGLERKDSVFYGAEVLLKCSGVCIFSTSLTKEKIEAELSTLYKEYYYNFGGKLQIKYIHFTEEIDCDKDRMEAIKEAKQRLRSKECLCHMIEQNQKMLFSFTEMYENVEELKEIKEYNFAKNIDELYSEGMQRKDTFRIAIIKADLDGMGEFFKQEKNYFIYKKVSEILNEFISVDYLDSQVKKFKSEDREFKLFPLYVAGDDIFFAVPVKNLRKGVQLCSEILGTINKEIKAEIKDKEVAFALSIGIEITCNNEPIRYYYERIEKQLQMAKSADKHEKLKRKECIRIGINNSVFFQYDKKIECPPTNIGGKEVRVSNWFHLLSSVTILNTAISEGFKGHHFLYGLLQKLEDLKMKGSGEIERSNQILYHLLPKHLENKNESLRKNELLLIEKLMAEITVKQNGHGQLKFDLENCESLKRYVGLLLLFIDERFDITKKKQTNPKVGRKQKEEKKRIQAVIFNRTRRYLYEMSLCETLKKEKNSNAIQNIEKLRETFVVKGCYYPKNSKSKSGVQIYQRLPITTSMLHRLGQKKEKDMEKVAQLIGAIDNRTKIEYQEAIKRKEKEQKAPPALFFERKKFLDATRDSGIWNSSYIDTLLILGKYDELSILYKEIYS